MERLLGGPFPVVASHMATSEISPGLLSSIRLPEFRSLAVASHMATSEISPGLLSSARRPDLSRQSEGSVELDGNCVLWPAMVTKIMADNLCGIF